MINAILACDDKGGVSKNGTLPWPKNSRDLRWFKENTLGHIVVSGSTTWKDPHMPRPLPRRRNILATSRPIDFPGADGYIQGDLCSEVQEIEKQFPGIITWIIGGPKIVEQTLEVISDFYISRIPGEYNCDTFLPLEKIQTMFDLSYEERHSEVTFQIWKNNATIS